MTQTQGRDSGHGISHSYTSPDGLSLHYVEYGGGNGTPVLCLPGLSRNGRDFAELAVSLCHERTVYCLDFRGRGQSEWDPDPSRYTPPVYVGDVMTLLDALALNKVILIGTSLGGIVSAGLCQTVPHRIAGVVLNDIGPVIDPAGLARIGQYVGTATVWPNWDEAVAAIRLINAPIYPDFTEAQWLAFAKQTCKQNKDGSVVQDYDPAIAQAFGRDDAAGLDLWPLFETLKSVPGLLIRGALSDLLSAKTAEEMTNRLPELKLITVPNRGHVPTLTEPHAAVAIETFVARVDTL
jgi:pimeloyl-ACP methyl ester carboxylesterase